MRIRNCTSTCTCFRLPLLCTGRTLCQFPLEAKQVFEEVIAPFCWRSSPCTFETTGNGVCSGACAKGIFPTKALLLNTCCRWFLADIFTWVSCSVGLTKGVTTCNQRYRFLVIHRHAAEGFANVASRCNRIRFSVRTFWIHIDQS